MNDKRRKLLREALEHLELAAGLVMDVSMEEQMAHDNLPEQFQYNEQGEKMDEAIANLEEAGGLIDEASQLISSASE